jgi:hypothetical protein
MAIAAGVTPIRCQQPPCLPYHRATVGNAHEDWRRTGQEAYLSGRSFTWKRYQAYSGNWDHDHCEFCWTKFLDPAYAEWMRERLASGAEGHADAGYANLSDDTAPAARYWVCRDCFEDFRAELRWAVVESDPGEWPYDTPEPDPRPTAADFSAERESSGP